MTAQPDDTAELPMIDHALDVLLPTLGSAGDIYPVLALGRALRARGHRAIVVANDHYRDLTVAMGLDFVALGTEAREVLIYGASGYTGKLVAEYLATRNIPFYMAGRTRSRLETALDVVKQRVGGHVDAQIVTANNTVA